PPRARPPTQAIRPARRWGSNRPPDGAVALLIRCTEAPSLGGDFHVHEVSPSLGPTRRFRPADSFAFLSSPLVAFGEEWPGTDLGRVARRRFPCSDWAGLRLRPPRGRRRLRPGNARPN